jgi:lipopolysaccharide biosynthesis glycosyltransferase
VTRARRPALDQRLRHLLGDLRRADTRGGAVQRVRRRVGSEIGARLAGDAPGSSANEARGAGASPAEARAAVRAAGDAVLAESIARGEPLERAAARAVDALAASGELDAAWSLAEGLGRLPNGRDASAIAHLVLLHRRKQLARGWPIVHDLDPAVARRFAPLEAVDAALASGGAEARARALAIGDPSPDHDAATLVGLAGRFLAFGERDRAAALVAAARARPSLDLDIRRRRALDLIDGWLRDRTPAVPDGAIPFAVLGYASPDPVLTSGNLGDSVQTLGMLGNLVRHAGITFIGDDGLGALATELQARVRPGLRVAGGSGVVRLIPVDRDFSSGAAVPPDTWMFAFGWHMHPLFDLRSDFPYHPNLRPIYVSFHVNRLDMLSDAALEELREHGPVGCRDWSTVFLLLSAGVDAFFSGCVSLTIDALFPTRAEAYAGHGPLGLIDVAPHAAGKAKRVRTYGHQDETYAVMPLTDGLRAADAALAGYQRLLDRAITNRLHAYLPLTALGVPVDFRPGRKGDIRFAGLMGLEPDDERVTAIRDGIRGLIDGTLARILAGGTPDEVYAHWRAATRERVVEAKARFAAPARDPETTIDVAESVAGVLANARQLGPAGPTGATIGGGGDAAEPTHVVVAFDDVLLRPAAVLVESLVTHAAGPLHLWILARGIPDAYVDWLGRAFPDLPITILPCDRLTYGAKGRPYRIPKRISISTMDRLFLPGLLPDVRRVVYLDVDTLALDDVGKLARIDLGGRPIAARDTALSEAASWQAAVRPLDEPVATEFRRAMAQRHGFGGACLNAGVLVMDLDRMRRDDFTRRSLALVETYGLHDQDAMLAYTGPDRQLLHSRWNALPVLEDVADPALIHWAAMGKPWNDELAFAQDRWREVADRLEARAGRPPTA